MASVDQSPAGQIHPDIITNIINMNQLSFILICTLHTIHLASAVRGPPRAEKRQIKHVAKVGESLKIKCPIHGYPQPIVSWEKDQDDISYAWSRYRTTRKTLKIKNVAEEDKGVYICTGINGFGKAESRIELVVINPEDFPSISDSDISKLSEPVFSAETVRTTKDIILNPGASVSLLCSATGFPAPQLSWYKNNEHFRDSGPGLTGLSLDAVSASDSGVYTCMAQNMVGSASLKYRLKVRTGPGEAEAGQGVEELTSRVSVSHGGTALIDCKVNTDTRPSVKWLKKLNIYDLETESTKDRMEESQIISVGEEHYRIIGDDENLQEVGRGEWLSQLIVRNARLQDRGMYICFVTSGGRGFNFKQSYLTVIEDFAKEVEREFPLLAVVIVLALVMVLAVFVSAIVYRICRRQKLSETSSDTSERTGTEAGAGVTQQLLRGPGNTELVYTQGESGRSSTPLHSHAHLVPLSRPLGQDRQESLSSVAPYYRQCPGRGQQ